MNDEYDELDYKELGSFFDFAKDSQAERAKEENDRADLLLLERRYGRYGRFSRFDPIEMNRLISLLKTSPLYEDELERESLETLLAKVNDLSYKLKDKVVLDRLGAILDEGRIRAGRYLDKEERRDLFEEMEQRHMEMECRRFEERDRQMEYERCFEYLADIDDVAESRLANAPDALASVSELDEEEFLIAKDEELPPPPCCLMLISSDDEDEASDEVADVPESVSEPDEEKEILAKKLDIPSPLCCLEPTVDDEAAFGFGDACFDADCFGEFGDVPDVGEPMCCYSESPSSVPEKQASESSVAPKESRKRRRLHRKPILKSFCTKLVEFSRKLWRPRRKPNPSLREKLDMYRQRAQEIRDMSKNAM